MTRAVAAPVRTRRAGVEDRPFIVIWEVTRACALACIHCRADAITCRDPGELTTDQGRALLDDLASYEPPRPMVVLTGGDPFERPDLVELIAHGTGRGLHVSIAPSVTPRLTAQALREVRRAGAGAVSLSIDGGTAATHDAFRGIPGTFEETLRAARDVREAGLRLQVNTTVTAANAFELPQIMTTANSLGAGLWSVFFLVPTGRGSTVGALPPDLAEDVLWWLHEVADRIPIKTTEAPHFRRVAVQRSRGETRRPGPLGTALLRGTPAPSPDTDGAAAPSRRRPPLDVNAGRGFAFVDHHGEVQPSGFLPVTVGSVLREPFPSIYRDAPLLRRLRDPDRLEGRCGRCDHRTICGGSRSRAWATTDNPFAEDPSCAHGTTAG